jgi:hypothetical protein
MAGRMFNVSILLRLREHDYCHLRIAVEAAHRGKKSGAVSEDRATPHENPNLTFRDQTRKGGFRSINDGKRTRVVAEALVCWHRAFAIA